MIVTPAYPRIIPQVQRGQVRDLDRGLVGHWPFDFNANDVSGNGNNGLVSGAIKTKGIIRGAYKFNGTSDYINLGTATHTNYLTYSMWMKTPEVLFSDYERIISDYDGTDMGWQILTLAGTNACRLRIDTAAGYDTVDTTPVYVANQWIHVATTYDGVKMAIYINARKNAEKIHAYGGVIAATGNTRYVASATGTTGFFQGELSDLRIYNRVLSFAEIKQLYQLGASKFTTFLRFGSTQDFLDGKVYLFLANTRPLDGKVDVNTPTDKLDGKADLVDSTTLPFDGKARVKDVTTVSLDGKAEVLLSSFDLIDGKTRIKDAAADLLDGKSIIKDTVINLLDGRSVIKNSSISLLDGMLDIPPFLAQIFDGRVYLSLTTAKTLLVMSRANLVIFKYSEP